MTVLQSHEGGYLTFRCPGCKSTHTVAAGSGPGLRWEWNNDLIRPTFSPSIKVQSGHYIPGHEGQDCWCTFTKRTGEKSSFECVVCHSFVEDGRIRFLDDCTHSLAGQTVDLPAWTD